jgi:hypothetical protein
MSRHSPDPSPVTRTTVHTVEVSSDDPILGYEMSEAIEYRVHPVGWTHRLVDLDEDMDSEDELVLSPHTRTDIKRVGEVRGVEQVQERHGEWDDFQDGDHRVGMVEKVDDEIDMGLNEVDIGYGEVGMGNDEEDEEEDDEDEQEEHETEVQNEARDDNTDLQGGGGDDSDNFFDGSSSTDEEHTLHSRPEERAEILSQIADLEEAVPQLTDDYKIVDMLGSGTFSSVYKALDIRYHTTWDNTPWHGVHPPSSSAHYQSVHKPPGSKVFVAIKQIYVSSSAERIRNEISIMEDCRGCRHVSQLITAFRHMDQVVAIMPYQRNDDFRVSSLPLCLSLYNFSICAHRITFAIYQWRASERTSGACSVPYAISMREGSSTAT